MKLYKQHVDCVALTTYIFIMKYAVSQIEYTVNKLKTQ